MDGRALDGVGLRGGGRAARCGIEGVERVGVGEHAQAKKGETVWRDALYCGSMEVCRTDALHGTFATLAHLIAVGQYGQRVRTAFFGVFLVMRT